MTGTNAINEVMTPAEIEAAFGLSSGAVRQYLKRHQRRMIADGIARQPDKRTWLIDKQFAVNTWGK